MSESSKKQSQTSKKQGDKLCCVAISPGAQKHKAALLSMFDKLIAKDISIVAFEGYDETIKDYAAKHDIFFSTASEDTDEVIKMCSFGLLANCYYERYSPFEDIALSFRANELPLITITLPL